VGSNKEDDDDDGDDGDDLFPSNLFSLQAETELCVVYVKLFASHKILLDSNDKLPDCMTLRMMAL
jgi:hypothetical protein